MAKVRRSMRPSTAPIRANGRADRFCFQRHVGSALRGRGQTPRAWRHQRGAVFRDARPADVSTARIEGFRRDLLVRDCRAGGHPQEAVDRLDVEISKALRDPRFQQVSGMRDFGLRRIQVRTIFGTPFATTSENGRSSLPEIISKLSNLANANSTRRHGLPSMGRQASRSLFRKRREGGRRCFMR